MSKVGLDNRRRNHDGEISHKLYFSNLVPGPTRDKSRSLPGLRVDTSLTQYRCGSEQVNEMAIFSSVSSADPVIRYLFTCFGDVSDM